jgi:amino acid adenylation domain-containing protein/FkbM family methyltransferase
VTAETGLDDLSAVKLALLSETTRGDAAAVEREPIAILGYDCRFPGGETPEAFWQLLCEARCAVGPVPPDRWDNARLYSADPAAPGTIRSREGAFLPDIRGFDAGLFHISGREAAGMDPQQRLLLETAWQALERSAVDPGSLAGSQTGVFIGLASSDYAARITAQNDPALVDGHFGSGISPAFAAGRLAHVLGTMGPAVTLDATCASSLVALHQACQSLRGSECDLAIVGGVHLSLSPGERIYLSQAGALAPDGRSKPFAEEADGFGGGEGCAVLVLMRLSQALRQRHAIVGLIRGSAVAHDGAGGGLTVPNPAAQEQVIRSALVASGLAAESIDFVEAHGTGTELGDPIELRALSAVFAAGRPAEAPLPIGAVKANIGHSQAAAGLCGVVKLLLALEHETLPAQPPIRALSRHVDWPSLGVLLNTEPRPWPRGARPRRAGVSAFGLSGTNAHVVIEETPRRPAPAAGPRPCNLYPLSARDPSALRALARTVRDEARALPSDALAAFCHSAAVGRARHPVRTAVRCASPDELAERLGQLATGTAAPGATLSGEGRAAAGVVFMVSGQGSAVPGAGAALYRDNRVFRGLLDRAAAAADPLLDVPLTTVLFDPARGPALLAQTRYAQPALAALGWSLGTLWQSWGVPCAALIGHSLGEYTAAALAGMLSPEALMELTTRRGALMARTEGKGGMLAIRATAAHAAELITRHPALSIAALNAPQGTVVAGPATACAALKAELDAMRLAASPLPVDCGFHSALMDPIAEELEALAQAAGFTAPERPIISGLTGALHPAGQAPEPAYWARQARQPVRFQDGLNALHRRGHRLFVEIGPRPVLSILGAQTADDCTFLPSLGGTEGEWETLFDTLSGLWFEGADIDWAAVNADLSCSRLTQAPGPLNRKPYWFRETLQPPAAATKTAASNQAPAEGLADMDASAAEARIRAELQADLSRILEEPSDAISADLSFAELGADSIMLAEAGRTLMQRYGVTIPLKSLFGELGTVAKLAGHLARTISTSSLAPALAPTGLPPSLPPAAASTDPELATLMNQQLAAMTTLMQAQLATFTARGAGIAPPAAPAMPAPPVPAQPTPTKRSAPAADEDPRRAAHRQALTEAFNRRTIRSKALAEARRPRFADVRAAAGFRPSVKELLYPITGDRAEGSRIWDVDGNEYIDISMDFGVNLFGHAAPVIREAMSAQLDRGLALGPRSPLAGEVADLVCELTGMDRVLFNQSGTESVMTAVRLARLVRGRSRIAVFRNSYHGHFDGFLGDRVDAGGRSRVMPVAGGIPQAYVDDLLVLDYGADSALEAIAAESDGLAAVLVEPVQSRALHLQPREFLHRLRELTARHGIVLIFDEMITGFRVHPGGAQAWFGVEADLATYGKTLGGGVPMAAVAARGRLLDGIDGGVWRYGDDSAPGQETTFFAGTFNNHPLGLAAASAVLSELKRRGPTLQEGLNARTAEMAERLNRALGAAGVPLSVVSYGSTFRFAHKGNLDLLYFHLLQRGVFVWEGRNCFLSTAHDAADIDAIVARTLDSVAALQEGGFLAGTPLRASRPVAPQEVAQPETLPLTQTQVQILFANARAAKGTAPYTETVAAELSGRLDQGSLERAVQDLVARHEALRTTIDEAGQCQRVREATRVPLRDADAGDGTSTDDWLNQIAAEPFDLSRESPLRVGLLRLGPERHLLALVTHHALVDGWSLRLIMEELGQLYARHATGAPPLPPVEAQARDHLARLRRLADAPDSLERSAFWRDMLDDPPPPVPLAADGPRPLSPDRRGGRIRLTLPDAARRAIEGLARRNGVTLFAATIGATLAYLHRLYDRDDLLIGVPAHGRRPEEARIVTQAAQLMPVRSRITAVETLDGFIRNCADQLAEQAERQSEIELAALVALVLERPGGALNVTFNLDRITLPGEIGGLAATLRDTPATGAKFDLSLNLTVAGERWHLDLDHDADSFAPDGIRRLGERWIAWVMRLAEAADLPVMDLPVLDAPDLALIAASNATTRDYTDTGMVPQLIAARAEAMPDAPALRFEGGTTSHAELHLAARRLAGRLAAAGITRGDIVAIALPRSVEQVTALLGILYVGAAWLPVDPEDPPARIAGLLEDAGTGLVVCDAQRADLLAGLSVRTLVVGHGAPEGEPMEPVAVGSNDAAYVLFTSGSTGRPKAVISAHGGLRNRLHWMQDRFPIGPGSVVLQKTPCTFDVSVWEFLWPLMAGATMCLARPGGHRDPAYLAGLIVAEEVTVTHFVPSMLDVFLDHPDARRCIGLTQVMCSGEAMGAELRDRFFASGLPAELHNLYGPTEASIDVTHWMCQPGDVGAVPIGRPIANTRIEILDARRRPVAPGVEGDLFIGGCQLASGYLNRPELTAERFPSDPGHPGKRRYHSGDRARYRQDGAIEYLGRGDSQVKLRGIRIELGEIEARLAAHPGVREAVVTVDGPEANRHLVGWVIPQDPRRDSVALEFERLEDGLLRTRLPGGRSLLCTSAQEVRFMVEETRGDGFVPADLGLPRDAVVIDAGANIGVFTLSILDAAPEAHVFACEAISEVAGILRRNVEASGGRVTVEAQALGAALGEAEFTWYPGISILSGRNADAAADAATLRAYLGTGADATPELLDEILASRLSPVPVRAKVTTISDLIGRHGLGRIDLLKIDVEGDEEAVLAGIAPADWGRIDRILVEVDDRGQARARIEALLMDHGFVIFSTRAGWAEGTGMVLLTALRPHLPPPERRAPATAADFDTLVAALRDDLARHLPAAYVPTLFFRLDALPLSAHGKLDRRKLRSPDPAAEAAPGRPAATPLETELLELWRGRFGLDVRGTDQDFFGLGGQSLMAAELLSHAQKHWQVRIDLRSFLAEPTIARLAELISCHAAAEEPIPRRARRPAPSSEVAP